MHTKEADKPGTIAHELQVQWQILCQHGMILALSSQ
jgi:hypothetical protein